MKSCVCQMWFYGFWNNVADHRLNAATNAWNSSMSFFLSYQVSRPRIALVPVHTYYTVKLRGVLKNKVKHSNYIFFWKSWCLCSQYSSSFETQRNQINEIQ